MEAYAQECARLRSVEFPVPEFTPFDGDAELRRLFLDGYQQGLEYARRKEDLEGGGDVICHFPKSEEDRAFAAGFDAGRFQILDILHNVLTKLLRDQDPALVR